MKAPENCDELRAAVAENPTEPETRRYLIAKSIDLGCFDAIPDEWEIDVKEEKGNG